MKTFTMDLTHKQVQGLRIALYREIGRRGAQKAKAQAVGLTAEAQLREEQTDGLIQIYDAVNQFLSDMEAEYHAAKAAEEAGNADDTETVEEAEEE